ncbi:hypothetical protein [Agromyces sp. NPDC058126]|uniref:hypothetical protein n=1 Tax=Agromyces sp. NPDC058126 TaxID=3346350 RepID=UPI0036DD7AC1
MPGLNNDHQLERRLADLQTNLRRAMGDTSPSDVAKAAGLDPEDVTGLLGDTIAGDLYVVSRLEAAFGLELWPRLNPLEPEASQRTARRPDPSQDGRAS